MLNLLAEQRILSAVEINVFADHWDTRNGFQFLWDWYFYGIHTGFSAGADHDVTDFQHWFNSFSTCGDM
jgi:hypothetical protein